VKQILVGVDGSNQSKGALKYAEQIARATGSGIIVVSAASSSANQMPESLNLAASELQCARDQAEVFAKEAAAAVAPGVKVQIRVAEGSAAAAIAGLAFGNEVEMVVVGHRGRNAVARALLGSVADELVQISPKPVLVVR
jgi:nucleotide-binding universal stress UspA family protein